MLLLIYSHKIYCLHDIMKFTNCDNNEIIYLFSFFKKVIINMKV